uniref:Uncharacterized protein n=1 Tax=Rhizophagus irregularis (strain DAOM 181602 / DAOM 197198 / MUCL 43194) TaxID=747089 RepID=U9T1W9_RHIID
MPYEYIVDNEFLRMDYTYILRLWLFPNTDVMGCHKMNARSIMDQYTTIKEQFDEFKDNLLELSVVYNNRTDMHYITMLITYRS